MTETTVDTSKRSGKRLLRTAWQAIVELIYLAPIYLTIGIYLLPMQSMIIWFLCLVIAYIIPQIIFQTEKPYKNYIRVGFIVVISAIIVAVLYPTFSSNKIIISAIICFVATMWFMHSGIRNVMYTWRASFTSTHMFILVIAYLVLQILKVLLLTELADYNGLFYGCGIIAIILLLFITNERSLSNHQTVDESSRTFRMALYINRAIIAVISIVLIGLVLFRTLQERIENWFMNLIRQLLTWLSSIKPEEVADPTEQVTPPPMTFGDEMVPKEPSVLWMYIELIAKYLVIIMLAAAAVVLLVYGSRKLKKLLARLFNPYMLAKDEDNAFIDEVEELVPIAKRSKPKKSIKRKEKKLTLDGWAQMSNRDKARGLYTYVVKEHIASGFSYKDSFTAKQTLEGIQLASSEKPNTSDNHVNSGLSETSSEGTSYEQLIDVYDQARYGEGTMNTSILQRLYDKFVAKK